ncbi:DNA-binding protein [Streptantibioticus cattleyicolor]|nr:DNA-binding protein [Streptomyces sp. SID5468]
MEILARAAAYLGIPPGLVGLADTAAGKDGSDPVERRGLLAGAAAVVVAPALAVLPAAADADDDRGAMLRATTTALRRLDGTMPSRQLSDVVLAHLRLVQAAAREAEGGERRVRLAAAGSEAAGLAGWLSWDMADHGSARTWYGAAIKAARRSGDPLLAAYQIGSLAQMEADTGNAAQALRLIRSARQQLGANAPVVADAWLSAVEAQAYATAGDERLCDRALTRSRAAARRMPGQDAPPWPWVFAFDERKVDICRISCGARLRLASWVFGARDDGAAVMPTAHAKQRALAQLDVATGHFVAGHVEAAYTLATQAVETGLRYRSGRVVERARGFRRAYSSATPPRIVREFDDRLHDVYM